VKTSRPRRVSIDEARNVPDRTSEADLANEQQARILEGVLQLLRSDGFITPREFAVASRLIGLFEHQKQSPESIAKELDITVQEVDRHFQNALGKMNGRHNSVIKWAQAVASKIKNIDEFSS